MHWPHGSLPSQRIFLRLHSVQAWGVVMRRVPATLGLALLEAVGCFFGMIPWTGDGIRPRSHGGEASEMS